ncbi:MAG: hypothetical protein KDA76_17725 [Planctomycetaceae bacterium]|nr:hypothetical protein [Planctomycetaceae bacterium]
MSNEPKRSKPVVGFLLRMSLLLCVLVALSLQFYTQRKRMRDTEEVEQAARAELFAQDQRSRIELTPLEKPDYFGEPKFSIDQFPEARARELQGIAEAEAGWIRTLKLQKQAARPANGQSVPVSAGLPIKRERVDYYLKYRLRELEAYERITADADDVKEAGSRFLKAYIELHNGGENPLSDQEVHDLGQAAIEAGSQDPLIRLYFTRMECHLADDLTIREDAYRELLPALQASRYPRIVHVFFRHFAYESAEKVSQEVRTLRSRALAVAIVRWLEAESQDPAWARAICFRLINIWGAVDRVHQASILNGCLQSGKINPALVHMLLGVHYYAAGWDIRGTRLAKDVKQEAWPEFERHLKLSRTHLEYSWMLEPLWPFTPDMLISVTTADYDPDYSCQDWFYRTCEAEFDFPGAYPRLLNSLRPRWGGSVEQMEEFARQCLATNRFDTIVPYILIDTIADIESMELPWDPELKKTWNPKTLLTEFLQKREAYRADHPDEKLFGDTTHYHSLIIRQLFLNQMGEQAMAEYRLAKDKINWNQLQDDHYPGHHYIRRLFAAQEEHLDRVMKLDETLRQEWPADTSPETLAELAGEIAELRSQTTDPVAREFFEHAERIREQLERYFRGEWVSLDFTDDHYGWEIRSDTSSAPDGHDHLVIQRTLNTSYRIWAHPLARFSRPFHIEATMTPSSQGKLVPSMGIHWRHWSHSTSEKRYKNLFVGSQFSNHWGRDSEFCAFLRPGYTNYEQFSSRVSSREPRFYSLKLWPQWMEGQALGVWIILPFAEPTDGYLTLGTEPIPNNKKTPLKVSLEITGVRIRKLTMPPPLADQAPLEERDAYWSARVDTDSTDLVAHAKLAEIRLSQGNNAEVCRLVDRVLELNPRFDRVRQLRGRALMLLGQYQAAADDLEIARKEPYDLPITYYTSAELHAAAPLESLRDKSAMSSAEFSLRIGGQADPLAIASVAVCAAENGDFERARQENQRAIDLATDEELKQQLTARQALYESDQPFLLPTFEPSEQ